MVVIKNIKRTDNIMRCDFSSDFCEKINSLSVDINCEKLVHTTCLLETEHCANTVKQVMARLIQIQNEPVFQDKEFIVNLDYL